MANVYQVTNEHGTEEFTALAKVAAFIGVKRVSKEDVVAGKYPQVSLLDADEVAVAIEEPTEEEVTTEEVTIKEVVDATDKIEIIMVGDAPKAPIKEEPTPAPTDDQKQVVLDAITARMEAIPDDSDEFDTLCDLEDAINDDLPLTNTQQDVVHQLLTNTDNEDSEAGMEVPEDSDEIEEPSDVEYPEVGTFDDQKKLKKYIKSLSDASLAEWCALEGWEYKPNDHESINRMRMAVAINHAHFPETKATKSKKSKSKYADYTTEQLVGMALEADVEVPDDKGDLRICRMYTIMALKKAGILD